MSREFGSPLEGYGYREQFDRLFSDHLGSVAGAGSQELDIVRIRDLVDPRRHEPAYEEPITPGPGRSAYIAETTNAQGEAAEVPAGGTSWSEQLLDFAYGGGAVRKKEGEGENEKMPFNRCTLIVHIEGEPEQETES